VTMLAPYKGRVYDPCCGSGGMFVQSEKFIEEHGGKLGDISVYGQESNSTTWRLAKMNLAIRGIDSNLGQQWADTLRNDQHKDLKADYVLANPPFNDSDWGGEHLREDARWQFGTPPSGNANFAWVQHFIHHLSPTGQAGFVLANGSMSSQSSGEGDIRKAIIEADLIDCMVALPGHLFYNMHSQVCLWFIARNKNKDGWRDRRGEILFIDARNMGTMTDRTHRELSAKDIETITSTYHSWAQPNNSMPYTDVLGFCKAASLVQVRNQGYNLIPARYVGSEEMGGVDLPAAEALEKIYFRLGPLAAESAKRAAATTASLGGLLIAGGKAVPRYKGDANLSDISIGELSHHIAESAAEFARILFRSWFVDFEPAYAKSQSATPKVPAEIAALFPMHFEDSALGEIPKGWRVGTYADFLVPVSARIGDQNAPEYSATVRGLERRELRFNKQLAQAQTKNKKIIKNDLVFGLSRKVINFGLMTGDIGSVSPVYEIFHIKTDIYVPELVEFYIRYHMRMHIDILKSGAREGAPIDREYLLSKEVLIPDYKIQKAFSIIVKGGTL
jgi:type I restriction-modification system DNA methylase subunit